MTHPLNGPKYQTMVSGKRILGGWDQNDLKQKAKHISIHLILGMRTPQGEDPSPVILATAEGAAETSEVRSPMWP